MNDRRLWFLLAAGFLAAGGALAYTVYQDQRAELWVSEAIARLSPSLEEAPSLDRIQASTALSLLERASTAGHDDRTTETWTHFAQAVEYLQRGDLVFAQTEIELAQQLGIPSPELLLASAEIARRGTRLDEAKTRIAEALEHAPQNPRIRLVAAEIALDESDAAGAVRILRTLAEELPTVGRIHARLGLAYEGLDRFEEAQTAYRRALELNPRDLSSWINLGRLSSQQGDADAAVESFARALSIEPNDPDALLGRGLALAAQGNVDDAVADFQAAAEADPHEAEPWLALGDLQRQAGQIPEAIATYREALRREDADAASWLKLGNALVLAGETEPALSAFQEALDRAPELGPAYNGLGAALMRLGRYDAARTALVRAAELTPSDISPHLNLGLVEEAAGRPDAAANAWRSALELDPDHSLALRKLELSASRSSVLGT